VQRASAITRGASAFGTPPRPPPHGDKKTKRPWGNGQSDSGPWAIDNGTLGHWNLGEQVGQGDNAQCDTGIWGTGTKKHWDNGTLDNGAMDK
jgi:hypothetical protein